MHLINHVPESVLSRSDQEWGQDSKYGKEPKSSEEESLRNEMLNIPPFLLASTQNARWEHRVTFSHAVCYASL